jgi:hypothetical protein
MLVDYHAHRRPWAMVEQHLQEGEAEVEHHLQILQAVEVAAVVLLEPQSQVLGEGEEEALRGHHGPEGEAAAGGLQVQRIQAAEAAVVEECWEKMQEPRAEREVVILVLWVVEEVQRARVEARAGVEVEVKRDLWRAEEEVQL